MKVNTLEKLKDANQLRVMRSIKSAMDPNGILNPYKVISTM